MSGQVGRDRNPLLKLVAERAAATAAVNKLSEKTQDEFWIASMELRKLEQQVATFPESASGVIYPRGYAGQVERARERVAQAEHAFKQAAKRAQQANAELHNARKGAELWENQERHLASQRDAEAALPPAERERRQLRARLAELEGR